MSRSNRWRMAITVAAIIFISVVCMYLWTRATKSGESPQVSPMRATELTTTNLDPASEGAESRVVRVAELATPQPDVSGRGIAESFFQLLQKELDASDARRTADTRELMSKMGGLGPEEALPLYHAYIEKYPSGSETALMWSRISHMYYQLEQYDDALQAIENAKSLLAEDDHTQLLMDALEAQIHIGVGEFDLAGEQLAELVSRPVPQKIDDSTPHYLVTVPLSTGPKELAELYRTSGRIEEGAAELRGVTINMNELLRNNPEATWIESYIAGSFAERLEYLRMTDPTNSDAMYALADEFEAVLPGYKGGIPDSTFKGTLNRLWRRVNARIYR